jgi:hypothetical protein
LIWIGGTFTDIAVFDEQPGDACEVDAYGNLVIAMGGARWRRLATAR